MKSLAGRPNETSSGEIFEALGPLPSFVYDLYGGLTYLPDEAWRLNNLSPEAELLNWDNWEGVVSPEILFAIQHYIAETIGLEKKALSTAYNRVSGLLRCFRVGGPIEGFHQMDLRSGLRLKKRLGLRGGDRSYAMVYWKLFYYWAADRALPGTDPQVADELEAIVLPNPSTISEPVLTRDPDNGPISDEERLALERYIRDNAIPDFDQTVVMTFFELGYNPKNISMLEERDFIAVRSTSNAVNVVFGLTVPRIKKRNNRRETVARDISQQLGQAIEKLIIRNRETHGGPDEKRPIFYRTSARERFLKTPRERFAHHSLPPDLTKIVSGFGNARKIVNPKTKEYLQLTPRRLRYSYGTRMAELGTPSNQLAYLMDHSDDRCVMVYYKSSPRVVDRLDLAVETKAVGVWKWFLGQPFIQTRDVPAGIIVKGVTPSLKNVGDLGCCGAGRCGDGLNPPLTCYICPKFHPFSDGPHKEYLDEVRAYKKELREFAVNNPANPIPSALDEIERAIAEAVQLQADLIQKSPAK